MNDLDIPIISKQEDCGTCGTHTCMAVRHIEDVAAELDRAVNSARAAVAAAISNAKTAPGTLDDETVAAKDSIVAEEKPAPIAQRSPATISNPPALWEVRAYVTLPSGTVTETILSGSEPLRAGTLTIIRTNLHEDGAIMPIASPEVGASVTLDWKKGGEHNIDI